MRPGAPRFALPLLAALASPPASATEAWTSFRQLSGSNGFSPFVFNAEADRFGRGVALFDQLWDHPYARLSADGPESRDLLWEATFGWRAAGGSGWADDASRLASLAYLPGTGIVEAVRDEGDLRLTEHGFAPMSAPGPALVLIAHAENVSGRDLDDVSIPLLFNLDLGGDRGDGRWVLGETARWVDGVSALVEQGTTRPAAAVYLPLSPLLGFALSPEDPRAAVDDGEPFQGTATTGVRDDVVAAFDFQVGTDGALPAGADAWVGALVWVAPGGDPESLVAAASAFVAGRGPEALLADEEAIWADFQARTPAVAGIDADTAAVLAQQAAFLKMFQVREPGAPFGQIPASGVAAAPVGGGSHVWNITWPRDAAYATVGLARACHLDEARDSLLFFLDGDAGDYEDWVGRPYRISVCRYHGDGSEESDWNEYGPNVEYDDFGLFLWALAEYVERSGDDDLLAAWFDVVAGEIADVIVSLVDDTGLLAPDSSIWETHWYGRQAHHAWTSIWAAVGLTRAAALAERVGDAEAAARWRQAASGITAAIERELVDPATGVLVGRREELSLGPEGYMDGAVVEAFAQGLLDPSGAVAAATLAAMDERLRLPSGGYKRNDDGDLYDEHEWAVIDLRTAAALDRGGREVEAAALVGWVVSQARANADIVPELYEPATAAYAGPAPMMGFGAGALWVTSTDGLDLETDLPCPDPPPGDPPVSEEPPAEEGCGSCAAAPVPRHGRAVAPWIAAGLAAVILRRRGGSSASPVSAPVLVRADLVVSGLPPVVAAVPSAAFVLALTGLVLAGCEPGFQPCTPPSLPAELAVGIDPDTVTAFEPYATDAPHDGGAGDVAGTDLAWSVGPGERVDATWSPPGTVDLVPLNGWTGTDTVTVTASNSCGTATTSVAVTVGEFSVRTCGTTLRYTPPSPAGSVHVAGTFNGWDPAATPMSPRADGSWDVVLAVDPGPYAYKFVVYRGKGGTGDAAWTCDPAAALRQCDPGYTWTETCTLGGNDCNSMLRVPACDVPGARLESLSGDREVGDVAVTLRILTAADRAPLAGDDFTVTLGDEDASASLVRLDAATFRLERAGLPAGKHSLRFRAADASGRFSDELFLPIWSGPSWDWRQASLYYAFVDRFRNGDPSNDGTYGTSWPTDYHGGDWAGVEDALDYLRSLGINALWLSPPQDNPPGAFDGTCGERYTGYHGYWPSDPLAPEDHFGTADDLRSLVRAAHARGMRVLVDFVGNHVHEDHPYYQEHAGDGWFTDPWICGEDGGWDLAPETCWFDGFLPDVDYYRPDTLDRFVEDALAWARDYDLDGFRIDAVKHMPHSFHLDLRARLREAVEHGDALTTGLVDPFYLVGETFTGDWGLIGRYISESQLSGQFDFPLYYAILATFARSEADFHSFDDTAVGLRDTWFQAGALMSNFLGNHDVDRFVAHASGQVASPWGSPLCDDDGAGWPASQAAPTDPAAYDRLIMAWAFLFTWEGIPLVYYGDEYGAPGFHDPDNRQDFLEEGDLSPEQARVLAAVRALGPAREAHPAFWKGSRNTWWRGSDQWAYGRVFGDDAVLVVFNRAGVGAEITNGLSWAGLPYAGGAYGDVLTGDVFTPDGDALTVTLGARTARALAWEEQE